MRIKAFLLLFLTAASIGCAHSAVSRDMFAKGDVALCKHCNCYMPLGLGASDDCPVCNCKQPAISCYRGH